MNKNKNIHGLRGCDAAMAVGFLTMPKPMDEPPLLPILEADTLPAP